MEFEKTFAKINPMKLERVNKMVDWQMIYKQAKEWVVEAGDLIKKSLENELTIETKRNAKDLVTNVDKEIETFFYHKIQSSFAEHRIIGEESKGHDISDLSGIVWIIDPIDGTMNFVNQGRFFAISVGIYEEGIGKIGITYDVTRDEMFHCLSGNGFYMDDKRINTLKPFKMDEALIAVNSGLMMENRSFDYKIIHKLIRDARGSRHLGTATIQLAYVAAGILDCYFSTKISPWDIAAGRVFLNEVGGELTNFKGQELEVLERTSIIASKPGFHEIFFRDYLREK
ncbi:MAG: inositol monophosphatase [Bacillales bacterium]|nr:inositol monophosphatase [Bacillales bacterium]